MRARAQQGERCRSGRHRGTHPQRMHLLHKECSKQGTAQHSMLLMAEDTGRSQCLRVHHSCAQRQLAPDRSLLDSILCGVEHVGGALDRVSVEH